MRQLFLKTKLCVAGQVIFFYGRQIKPYISANVQKVVQQGILACINKNEFILKTI
jgi:hypothetical protein